MLAMRQCSPRTCIWRITIVSICLTILAGCESGSLTAGVVTFEPWYDFEKDEELLGRLIEELGSDAEYLAEEIEYRGKREIRASSNQDCIMGVRKMRNDKWRSAANHLKQAVAIAAAKKTNSGIDCRASFALGVCYEQQGDAEQDRNEREELYRLAQEQYELANEQCGDEGQPFKVARLRAGVKREVLRKELDLTK